MNSEVRVYVLARKFSVNSKALLDLCRERGFDVKNQLSQLTIAQKDDLEDLLTGRKNDRIAQTLVPKETPSAPPRSPGLERLLNVGEKAGFIKLGVIASVAEIDPESAIFKIRKLTERLCGLLLKPNAPENLNDSVNEIAKRKLLGRKALAYLNQIRTLGNVAVHASDDLFDTEFNLHDVNNAADALACVIEEALARSRINPSTS